MANGATDVRKISDKRGTMPGGPMGPASLGSILLSPERIFGIPPPLLMVNQRRIITPTVIIIPNTTSIIAIDL